MEDRKDPRILLGETNERLRRLLDATGKLFKNNDPVIENLQNVLRQTTILQMLQGQYVVAIAGAPGAGKSTLVRLLYDLQTPDSAFVSGRTGRGERLPIWVREMHGIETPRAFVHAYRWQEEHSGEIECLPIDSVKNFENIAHDPNTGDGRVNIMLELQVEPRIFENEGCGFLLLPGLENYHQIEKRDTKWNQLILFSLIAASRYLLVVDNVANYQELTAYEQFQQWFQQSQPLFVLPRCENDPDGGKRKKEALQEKLSLTEKEADRVICTGLDDKTNWTNALRDALKKYSNRDYAAATIQLTQLAKLFDKVLFDVLSDIKLVAERRFYTEHTPMENALRDFMEIHETAARREEVKFLRSLEKALNQEADQFLEHSIQEYGQTSFWNHVENFAFRSGRASPNTLSKVEELVRGSWNKQIADFTARFYQSQLAAAEELKQIPLGHFEQPLLNDSHKSDMKDVLNKLPKLTKYALMQQTQRVGFLHDHLPQALPDAVPSESSLLPAAARTVGAFLPASGAIAAAAVAALFFHICNSVNQSERYNKRRAVSDTTRLLYDQTLSSYREDYARLANDLQDTIQNQLAKHLNVDREKSDYLNIQLRINQLYDSIDTVKELVNKRTAYGVSG